MSIIIKCQRCNNDIKLIIEEVGKKKFNVYKCSSNNCDYELGRKKIINKKLK